MINERLHKLLLSICVTSMTIGYAIDIYRSMFNRKRARCYIYEEVCVVEKYDIFKGRWVFYKTVKIKRRMKRI